MYIEELLDDPNPNSCYEVFRLKRPSFILLCKTLREGNYMKDTKRVRIEEALAIFCHIVGHGARMRALADLFQHSTEIICRHFKLAMRGLCRFGRILLRSKEPLDVHPYVRHNPKYYP